MKPNLNSIEERVIAAMRAERRRFLADRWNLYPYEGHEEMDDRPLNPICSNAP